MAHMPKATPAQNIRINNTKNDGENFFLTQPDHYSDTDGDFFVGEGQLCCDVYQDEGNIVVKSTMAGVEAKNLDISVSNDLLTVRGFREAEERVSERDYYCRECYWGTFSRSIVLPQEIDQNKVKATMKNGILTIILPKKYKTTSIRIKHLDD